MSSDRSDGGSEASGSGSERYNHKEGVLINAMQNAVSAQRAAFCCGGSVPILGTFSEGNEDRFNDLTGRITSPPVVLRWDLPSGMDILKRTPLSFNTFPFPSRFPSANFSGQSLSYSPLKSRY